MIFTPEFTDEGVLAEYPRPQFKRNSYFNLNGVWQYAITQTPTFPQRFQGEILVPYSPESKKSGVERQLRADEYLHYLKTFTLPENFNKGRVLLNVGACDQITKVYLNGIKVGENEGGYLPFTVDLTDALNDGENALAFTVTDDASSEIYGRGKQSYNRGGIWYTAVSGIWQTVWLESVAENYIKNCKLTPDYYSKTLKIAVNCAKEVTVKVFDGPAGSNSSVIAQGVTNEGEITLDVSACKPWTTDDPQLYPITLSTEDDFVETYFGLRSFSVEQRRVGKVFATNGTPQFHNGLLDQGYWLEGIYTPPSNKAMYDEIKAVKDLGFNMLRKHIKTEPLLWYHYCNILGVLVWQDFINGGGAYSKFRINVCPFINLHINDRNYKRMKRANFLSRQWFLTEGERLQDLLYNSVSVCLYTPFNEAWGQFDAVETVNYFKRRDGTRFYDHASGWQDKGGGDVKSRHIYFRKAKMRGDGKRVLALTEFGGYSFAVSGHVFSPKAFGYKSFKDVQKLNSAYKNLYEKQIYPAVKRCGLSAVVYTQLTDVEEEINGIFTFDRILKLDAKLLRQINSGLYEVFKRETESKE